jgi:hypothetical protein
MIARQIANANTILPSSLILGETNRDPLTPMALLAGEELNRDCWPVDVRLKNDIS